MHGKLAIIPIISEVTGLVVSGRVITCLVVSGKEVTGPVVSGREVTGVVDTVVGTVPGK